MTVSKTLGLHNMTLDELVSEAHQQENTLALRIVELYDDQTESVVREMNSMKDDYDEGWDAAVEEMEKALGNL